MILALELLPCLKERTSESEVFLQVLEGQLPVLPACLTLLTWPVHLMVEQNKIKFSIRIEKENAIVETAIILLPVYFALNKTSAKTSTLPEGNSFLKVKLYTEIKLFSSRVLQICCSEGVGQMKFSSSCTEYFTCTLGSPWGLCRTYTLSYRLQTVQDKDLTEVLS